MTSTSRQSGLQAPGDLEAGHLRHADVDDRQVRPQALGLFEGRRPGRDAGHVVPAAEDAGQRVEDAGIIVDDQDAGAVGFHAHAAPSACDGNDARTRVPAPGLLSI